MEEQTNVQFLEAILSLVKECPDPVTAWRTFRSKYDQNRLDGRTMGDREQTFLKMYTGYKEFPAQATMDIRVARVKEFLSDLAKAFLSAEVPELEVEDWFSHLEQSQHGKGIGVKRALEVYSLRCGQSPALRDRAASLWPKVFVEVSADEKDES